MESDPTLNYSCLLADEQRKDLTRGSLRVEPVIPLLMVARQVSREMNVRHVNNSFHAQSINLAQRSMRLGDVRVLLRVSQHEEQKADFKTIEFDGEHASLLLVSIWRERNNLVEQYFWRLNRRGMWAGTVESTGKVPLAMHMPSTQRLFILSIVFVAI